MGEKSGVTSPEHVRCSGGKTVCGCKARAQTTRDGTARYGWGKEEAVCEGWDHDRSIAASRAFGNGIQRILPLSLTEEEQEKFRRSCDTLRESYKGILE